MFKTLASEAWLVEGSSHKKDRGLDSGGGTYLGGGLVPIGVLKGANRCFFLSHINIFISLLPSLPLLLSLKSINTSSGEDFKNMIILIAVIYRSKILYN